MDELGILDRMVEGAYQPLSGRVRTYDQPLLEQRAPGQEERIPLQATINIQGRERQYFIQGGGGRVTLDWTIRLLGPRDEVTAAGEDLPTLLDTPYRDRTEGATVMYSHLVTASGIMRDPRSTPNAGQVLRFESHLVETG